MKQANKQTGLVVAIRGCVSWRDIQARWQTFPEKQKGEFWAIQCKYRQDTDHSLTWRDLSTFTGLAFGVCQGFSFGVVCSTTERITHVLKDQERIGFCALDVWQALDADFLKRLAKSINLADFAREIELKCWDRLAKLSWRPLEEAREFVRTLRLRSASEWRKHFVEGVVQKGSRPADIPDLFSLASHAQGESECRPSLGVPWLFSNAPSSTRTSGPGRARRLRRSW
jgi:hypothetical protein